MLRHSDLIFDNQPIFELQVKASVTLKKGTIISLEITQESELANQRSEVISNPIIAIPLIKGVGQLGAIQISSEIRKVVISR